MESRIDTGAPRERTVVGHLLVDYDMMIPDKGRIASDYEMLICPISSECGQTMAAAIAHANNAITFERFVYEHMETADDGATVPKIAVIKQRLWSLLEVLYYG